MDDLEVRIGRLFLEKLHIEVPSTRIDLFESGILDSLAFVEFLLQIEQQFGIRVSVDDLVVDQFRTLERIAQFVARRSAQPAA